METAVRTNPETKRKTKASKRKRPVITLQMKACFLMHTQMPQIPAPIATREPPRSK